MKLSEKLRQTYNHHGHPLNVLADEAVALERENETLKAELQDFEADTACEERCATLEAVLARVTEQRDALETRRAELLEGLTAHKARVESLAVEVDYEKARVAELHARTERDVENERLRQAFDAISVEACHDLHDECLVALTQLSKAIKGGG